MKKLSKKTIIPIAIVFGVGFVLALTYYAVFSVNVHVNQPISVDGNLEQSVDCDAGTTCIGDGITISNSGDEDRTIKIVKNYGNEAIEVDYVGKLDLSQKDISNWSLIGDSVELIYTLVGEDFEWDADLPDGYVLIYYKDAVVGLKGRLENPQPVIQIVSNISDLPQEDDANLDADYSEAPDYYEHKTGAKLWAVPSDAINVGDNTLDWSQMDEFLYETDLIRYFANAENEVVVPAGSFITFYPAFTPDTYMPEGDYEFGFEVQ